MSITQIGGYGNDYLSGSYGNDWLDGREGHDDLFGYEGHDTLFGWYGDDYLVGDSGNDILYGEAGNDTLTGSNPDFYDSGVYEYDTLVGGSGADTFVLGDWSEPYYYGDGLGGYATITDFNYWEGDQIQVFGSAYDYSLTPWGNGFDINYYGDVIGHVENVSSFDLNLYQDFIFV